MGVYSEAAKKIYDDNRAKVLNEKYNLKKVFNEAEISGYKTDLFYGGAEVVVDAHDENEAKLFKKLAVNDFETFKRGFDRVTEPVLKEYAVRRYMAKEDILNEMSNPKITAKDSKIYLQNLDEDGNRFIVRIDTSNGEKVYEEITVKEGTITGTKEMRVLSEEDTPSDDENKAPETTESENKTPETDNNE